MAPHPAVNSLAGRRSVLGQALQLGETLIHQVIAHVREALIFRVPFQAGAGALDRLLGHGLFAEPRPLGDPLDRMAIAVPGGEGHAAVEPGRVVP